MTRPKKADIGPYRYTVYFTPVSMTDVSGVLDVATRTIVVDGTQTDMALKETLLHESLHGHIDLTPFRSMGQDEEEKLVSALSPWLLLFIRSNPKIISFLQE